MEIDSKLEHLVVHWIDHNNAHIEQLKDWATQAEMRGLSRVAMNIRRAAEAMETANVALDAAQSSLNTSASSGHEHGS